MKYIVILMVGAMLTGCLQFLEKAAETVTEIAPAAEAVGGVSWGLWGTGAAGILTLIIGWFKNRGKKQIILAIMDTIQRTLSEDQIRTIDREIRERLPKKYLKVYEWALKILLPPT